MLLFNVDSFGAGCSPRRVSRVKKFVMSFLKTAGSWLVLLVLLGGIFVWVSSDYENSREPLPEDLFS